MDPGLALHKAIFAALRDGLSASIGVYDAVPQGAAKPYVTLDTNITSNADALVERRDVSFEFLTVWSETKGQEEVKTIMGSINSILHDNKLTLDTGTVVSVRVDRKTTRRDADNVTFSGQVTLRVMTHH